MSSKRFSILALLTFLAMFIVACAPQTVTVEVTKEVIKEVQVTSDAPVATAEKVEVIVTATPEPTANPSEKGMRDVMVIGIPSDITTLNYWASLGGDNTVYNGYVSSDLYPALYGFVAPSNQWGPAFAADFPSDIEEEGDFWVSTIPVRQDAMWSDGTPVTAEDWAFTIDTVLKLELGDAWAGIYRSDYLDRAEAVDANTLKLFYLQKPGLAVHQYGTLTGPAMPKHFWEETVAPLIEQAADVDAVEPLGEEPTEEEQAAYDAAVEERTLALNEIAQGLYQASVEGEPSVGPYKNVVWEQGVAISNEQNESYSDAGRSYTQCAAGGYSTSLNGESEDYYGGCQADAEGASTIEEGPYFASQLYQVYNQDTLVLALQSGEIDIAWTPNGLSAGQIQQLASNPAIEVATNPSNGFRYMAFNFAKPHWTRPVRQAINCMLDKDFLANRVLAGAALPAYSVVPESMTSWYNSEIKIGCAGLSAQARFSETVKILTDAGYTWETAPTAEANGTVAPGSTLIDPDGKEFPAITLMAPAYTYDPLRASTAQVIGDFMNKLGMPTKVDLTAFNNIVSVVFDETQQENWDFYMLGWGLTLYPDHVCEFFSATGGSNNMKYSNDEINSECETFLAATTLDEAIPSNKKLQALINEDLPYITLFTTPIRDAFDASSVNFQYTKNLDGLDGTQDSMIYAVSE